MRDRIEQTCRHLLECSSIYIGSAESAPVTTSPLEPLQSEPPAVWLEAVAAHLDDTARACADTAAYIVELSNSASLGDRWPEGISGDLYATVVDEMRFHVYYFHLYSELMREALVGNVAVGDPETLRPSLVHDPPQDTPSSASLARALVIHAGLSESEAEEWSSDLVRLYATCQVTRSAISELASQVDADKAVLCQRFVNVQAAMLELSIVLLRADVLCYQLLGRA